MHQPWLTSDGALKITDTRTRFVTSDGEKKILNKNVILIHSFISI